MKSGQNILVVLAGLMVIVSSLANAMDESPGGAATESLSRIIPREFAATVGDWGIAQAVACKSGGGVPDGVDIELTLDNGIQHAVEQALDAAMVQYHPEGSWAIVENVRTGEILAMASRFGNEGNEAEERLQSASANLAASAVFEPGSIFSVGVIAAAINEGLISTNDLFDCENGTWSYDGKPLRDFHPYGMLDVTGILRKSSNIGAAKIAVMLGEDRLHRYLTDFGFGKLSGLEISGEGEGCLRSLSEWKTVDVTRVAMGYTVSVTALQLLNMLCCIGNDGAQMRPHLVRKVMGKDGIVLLENKPEIIAQPVSAATAERMRSMLVEVTREGGTGTRAAVAGFNVAGKTGTAEKIKDGRHMANMNMASFMGILPAERPEIGIIVVLDNPQPMRTGSMSAAPVFAQIAEAAGRHLHLDRDEEQ